MVSQLKNRRRSSEEAVLKRLDIPDFRHMSKDKIMAFCGMLDEMDPEVAKKAIEQFPEFAKTAKEALLECQETIRQTISSSAESLKRYYDACDAEIRSLIELLKDEDLSFEEKKYVVEQMRDIEDHMSRKDSEHNRFLERLAATGVAAVAVVCGAMIAVLGGKMDLRLPGQVEDVGA